MKTLEEAKKLIESLMLLQEITKEGGYIFPCLRCGHHQMNAVADRNSLSRYADVYICNECGSDEAMWDMVGNPFPLNEWSMAISFEDQGDEEYE